MQRVERVCAHIRFKWSEFKAAIRHAGLLLWRCTSHLFITGDLWLCCHRHIPRLAATWGWMQKFKPLWTEEQKVSSNVSHKISCWKPLRTADGCRRIWASKCGFSLDGTQNVEYVDHVFTSLGTLPPLPPPFLRSVSWAQVLFLLSNIYTCDSITLALLQSDRALLFLCFFSLLLCLKLLQGEDTACWNVKI